MKKADERKWLDYKETFQDYAMEKIAILQNLKLPKDSIIHCLIDGINNIAIKSVAASISTESVDDFLEQMHHITSTCEVASADIIENSSDKVSSSFTEVSIDFNQSIENQLITVFQEVKNTEIPIHDDDYFVKINLRDESVYVFAPRRFAEWYPFDHVDIDHGPD
ncbi:penicillin-binding protein 4 family protein [Lasius niger]|uniref:Penicillin-binding protein 4 family protein n=1 Tax=Lasius niger TaxID=67767 RepID=A0A0J7N505_LASNI|nr:penicillin-binding protein 4 family protein [Lasius niger]